MPIVSITALGTSTKDVGSAVAAIVDYLEGRLKRMRLGLEGESPSTNVAGSVQGTEPTPAATADLSNRNGPPASVSSLGSYYADSTLEASSGWWLGRGVNGLHLTGQVDPNVFTELLLGNHPITGERLVGSSVRRDGRMVGVSPSWFHRILSC